MKILILSVSAGAGHLRAAEAVRLAATAAGHQAEHVDVMDLVPRLFRRVYCDSYLRLIERHPALWGYLYHSSDKARPDSTLTKLRRLVEGLNTRQLVKKVVAEAPDVVICTHFLPAQLLAKLRKNGTVAMPTWVVVTDFDVHLLWVHQGLSGYCVADEEVAWRIRERGIGATPVHVTGIPIMPVFAHKPDRAECARELGLDPARTTVLLMGGGGGVGGLDSVAERMLTVPGNAQLIACAGRNADLLRKLEVMARPQHGRLLPMGFTTTPERLMATADLAVSKPGGLTTSECLAMGLPMLVVSPIPGQEERNADFLLEHGAALKAHDLAGLAYRAQGLLADPARLAAMAAAAARLGRPQAATDIVRLATAHA